MLVGRGLTVRHGAHTVLADVDVDLEPGTILAVLGPNGAGKSTLLGLLAGERAPDAGTVELDGRALSTWPARLLARRRAVLPQSPTLTFPFTVLEVVALGRLPHGDRAHRDESIARACLGRVGLADFEARRYTTLSGGERQRVHLARALAQLHGASDEARYLLLDEPTAALDLAHVQRLGEIVRERATHAGIGVLLVLHDLNEAARLADRVLLLSNGRHVASGPAHDVLTVERIRDVWQVDVRRVEDGESFVFVAQ